MPDLMCCVFRLVATGTCWWIGYDSYELVFLLGFSPFPSSSCIEILLDAELLWIHSHTTLMYFSRNVSSAKLAKQVFVDM